MQIGTYEVSIELQSGYTLNVLMAATNRRDAQREVAKVLRTITNGADLPLRDWSVNPVEVLPRAETPENEEEAEALMEADIAERERAVEQILDYREEHGI